MYWQLTTPNNITSLTKLPEPPPPQNTLRHLVNLVSEFRLMFHFQFDSQSIYESVYLVLYREGFFVEFLQFKTLNLHLLARLNLWNYSLFNYNLVNYLQYNFLAFSLSLSIVHSFGRHYFEVINETHLLSVWLYPVKRFWLIKAILIVDSSIFV